MHIHWREVILARQCKRHLAIPHQSKTFAIGVMNCVKLFKTVGLLLHLIRQVSYLDRTHVNQAFVA